MKNIRDFYLKFSVFGGEILGMFSYGSIIRQIGHILKYSVSANRDMDSGNRVARMRPLVCI